MIRQILINIVLAVLFLTPGLTRIQARNINDPNPERLRREGSFLGIHFDFHAGHDCKEIGNFHILTETAW